MFMTQFWQLQEAKNKFSEVVARAEAGEVQIVTKHGVATAVVLSYAVYNTLSEPQRRLSELLRPFRMTVSSSISTAMERGCARILRGYVCARYQRHFGADETAA